MIRSPGEAEAVVHAIRDAGHLLVTGSGPDLRPLTRSKLNATPDIAGVVIVGGYGVVPSEALNALPRELAGARIPELDGFMVWSDDGYGDRDADITPEVPVSRLPDAGSASFLWTLLGNTGLRTPAASSGIRNQERPFADAVYGLLPNRAAFHISAPVPGGATPPFPLGGDLLYLMLHGDHDDATVFSGEDPATGSLTTALRVEDVPGPCPKVVFAGCCWGALIVDELALQRPAGTSARTPASSIALRCLENGANAFVGCTGAHYSPDYPDADNYGGPMHRLFWNEILAGRPAAMALFHAKIKYAQSIPERVGTRKSARALEHKILRQFTCLGLGW